MTAIMRTMSLVRIFENDMRPPSPAALRIDDVDLLGLGF